ncbi:MAG: 2,3-bisphosphoglycerate-dependent phosphoglycerate mutase [Gammaproteobacteria bacterium]
MPTAPDHNTAILIRHAQSEWNAQGRFTGWADPGLTRAGIREAERAGRVLAERGTRFDAIWTSCLQRASETARIVAHESDNAGIPIQHDWRLNERHYGALQGKNKEAMARSVGADQVWRWRRAYEERPPVLAHGDQRHPANDPGYDFLPADALPGSENLADTRARVSAFWNEHIVPGLKRGERPLIASHGNTLRALIMALTDMPVAEVERFEIPTGVPIVVAFDGQARAIGWHYLEVPGHPSADSAVAQRGAA